MGKSKRTENGQMMTFIAKWAAHYAATLRRIFKEMHYFYFYCTAHLSGFQEKAHKITVIPLYLFININTYLNMQQLMIMVQFPLHRRHQLSEHLHVKLPVIAPVRTLVAPTPRRLARWHVSRPGVIESGRRLVRPSTRTYGVDRRRLRETIGGGARPVGKTKQDSNWKRTISFIVYLVLDPQVSWMSRPLQGSDLPAIYSEWSSGQLLELAWRSGREVHETVSEPRFTFLCYIKARAGVANISEKIREARLRWLWRVERKTEKDVVMRTWKREVGGVRNWRVIRKHMKKYREKKHRRTWRMKLSQPTPNREKAK